MPDTRCPFSGLSKSAEDERWDGVKRLVVNRMFELDVELDFNVLRSPSDVGKWAFNFLHKIIEHF